MIPDSILTRFQDDNRAVAPIIGVIILFGFFTIALAGYQAEIVPQQNQEIEFDHNQEIQEDMLSLTSSIQNVGNHQSVRLRMGEEYPTRIITINPIDPYGRLFSQDASLDISGGTVVTTGATGDPQSTIFTEHDTEIVRYSPAYNEYQDPPDTVIENSLTHNQFEEAEIQIDRQRMIDGNDRSLDIVLVSSDIDKTTRSLVVRPETLDGPSDPVTIEPDGDEFSITLTTYAPDLWSESVGETYQDGESDARVSETTDDTVTIEFRDEWDITMTRVGVDGGEKSTEFSDINNNDDDDDDVVSDDPDLGPNEVAFDADDVTYTTDEITDGDADDTDLTIKEDISTDKLNVKLNSLEIRSGVTVETTGGGNGNGNGELKFEVDGGSIDASGAILKKAGGAGKDLKLEVTDGSGDIDITDAQLISDEKIKVEIKDDANGGSIYASGSELVSEDNNVELKVKEGDGNIDITDAKLASDNEIKVEGKDGEDNELLTNDDSDGTDGTRIVEYSDQTTGTTLKYKDIGNIEDNDYAIIDGFNDDN